MYTVYIVYLPYIPVYIQYSICKLYNVYSLYFIPTVYRTKLYREETAREDNGQIKWEKINNGKRKAADK